MFMSIRRVRVLTAGFYFACQISAQAAETADSSRDIPSDRVVVTATRTAVPADDSLWSVTILDRADIEARQALSLQELLQGESGIQMSNNGGLGKASSMFIRGAESQQVLVLVDGVRVGSSTLGSTAFQYLPVSEIGKVEIVRGPRSSLYGSEAIGGVIQLFTKRQADGLAFDANAAVGSHGTDSISANISGATGRWNYGLSASNLTSDGYPNCRGTPDPPYGGCYVFDSRPDGFHSVSGSVRAGVQINEQTDVQASFLRAQGGTRYAGSYTNHEDFVQQVASLAAHWTPIKALRVTLQVGQSHDNSINTLDFVEPPGSLFDTTRNSGSLQADWEVHAGQLLTLGTDYLKDHIASDTIFPTTDRSIVGVYGEYQGGSGPMHWALSARHDNNNQFGGKTTGGLGWGYHFAHNLHLTASYGTGFRAPTFNDLYYPFFGNTALKPETSRTTEIGVEQKFGRGRWSLRGFETNVHDLIGFDVNFLAANTDSARIRGVEAEGAVTLGPWTAAVTTSWLDPRNRTPDSNLYGNLLARRARETGHLEIARQWARVRAAVRVNAAGSRFNDAANADELGGYATADLLVDWTIYPGWSLQGKLANLADHRYETALYYPQDGRNYLVTLRYRPIIR